MDAIVLLAMLTTCKRPLGQPRLPIADLTEVERILRSTLLASRHQFKMDNTDMDSSIQCCWLIRIAQSILLRHSSKLLARILATSLWASKVSRSSASQAAESCRYVSAHAGTYSHAVGCRLCNGAVSVTISIHLTSS